MVFIGDSEENVSQSKKDKKQDIKIDFLQSAIDEINLQITGIESNLQALQSSISDNYSAQTQTLLNTLNTKIAELSMAIETRLSTNEIVATIGNFERLAATLTATISNLVSDILTVTNTADIKALQADTIETNDINTTLLNATSATIQNATINLLNVVSFTLNTLTAETITSEIVNADSVFSDSVESEKIKTDNISVKTWHTPISTPDNTELLKITIPHYDGIIHVVTMDKEFNVSICNNYLISYNQNGNYLYRIERGDNATYIYLANIGDTINYSFIYVGADEWQETFSEIVDKTGIKQTILEKNGTLFIESLISELNVLFVDYLPTTGEESNLYISKNNGAYIWKEETREFIPFMGVDWQNKVLANEAHIGDVTELETTAKNNLVLAANEIKENLDEEIETRETQIGDLTELETTAKNNLVLAINEIKENEDLFVKKAGDIVTGDLNINGELSVANDTTIDKNLKVSGDLIVTGSLIAIDEESLETSSDYVVLRKNNITGLGLTEKSGLVVHNYNNNKNASLSVDKNGIFRIADNVSEATTNYQNISRYGATYYQGITQTTTESVNHGVIVSEDVDELENTVFNNGLYYHYFNGEWFIVLLVDNKLDFDKTDPIEDSSLIETLNGLTKDNLFYYRSLSVMVISDSENQPILTRDEAEDMGENALLKWDNENNKAVTIPIPTLSNQILTSKFAKIEAYSWKNGAIDFWFNSDLTVASPILAPETTVEIGYMVKGDDNYYSRYEISVQYFTSTLGTVGNVLKENGNEVIITNAERKSYTHGQVFEFVGRVVNNHLYEYKNGVYEMVISLTINSSNELIVETDPTKTTTQTGTLVPGLRLTDFTLYRSKRVTAFTPTEIIGEDLGTYYSSGVYEPIYYNYLTSDQPSYEWTSGGNGSVSRFATKAEAEQALLIPEGQDGYIPNNGIVIVETENSYLEGENK